MLRPGRLDHNIAALVCSDERESPVVEFLIISKHDWLRANHPGLSFRRQ